MGERELRRLYASAELIVNLHGGTEPLPEHAETGRLVYLETDPVQLQVELSRRARAPRSTSSSRTAPSSPSARTTGAGLRASRLRAVPLPRRPGSRSSSTSGRQSTGDSGHVHDRRELAAALARGLARGRAATRGASTTSSERVLDLPRSNREAVRARLERVRREDRERLRAQRLAGHGRDDARPWTSTPTATYIGGSRGEFTVAKDQNVRLRTGWFSDRSATYLAAGRPVVTQDTGFGNVLPTGAGLFAFSTSTRRRLPSSGSARDYASERASAAEIAREYFDADIVLAPAARRRGRVRSRADRRPARSVGDLDSRS